MAEIFNSMAMNVREQESLYRSLLAAVQLLEERQLSLRANLVRHKGVCVEEQWGPTSLIPYVEDEHERLSEVAAGLYPFC
jgi:hypothetical protein